MHGITLREIVLSVILLLLCIATATAQEKKEPGHELIQAAGKGDMKAVKAAITGGADVNTKDENGDTALHMAVKESRLEIVKLLLEKGAQINARNKSKRTPRDYAITNPVDMAGTEEEKKAARTALERITKISEKLGQEAPFSKEELEISSLLSKHGAQYGDPPGRELFDSLSLRQLDYIRKLLDKGADVNYREPALERTLLHTAVSTGRKDVIKLLLSKGADVNAKDKLGEAPLHMAAGALEESRDTAKLLIEKGAKIDEQNRLGETPLHKAAGYNHAGIVRMLIKKGAILTREARFFRKMTPADYAIGRGSAEALDVLVEYGANISNPKYMEWGKRLAEEKGNDRILKILKKHIEANTSSGLKKRLEALIENSGVQKETRNLMRTVLSAKTGKEREETAVKICELEDKKTLPFLVEAMKYIPDKDTAGGVAWRIHSFGKREDVVKALRFAFFYQENQHVRCGMLWSLGRLRATEAVPLMLYSLDFEGTFSDTIAFGGIHALGMCYCKEAVPRIIEITKKHCKSEDSILNITSLESLGMIGDPRALDLIVEILGDETSLSWMRWTAANALMYFDKEKSRKALIKAVSGRHAGLEEKDRVALLQHAAYSLGEHRHPEGLAAVCKLLSSDSHKDLQWYVASILSRSSVNTPEIKKALLKFLRDEKANLTARAYAALALARSGEKGIEKDIRKLLKKAEPYEEMLLRISLYHIGNRRELDKMKALYEEREKKRQQDIKEGKERGYSRADRETMLFLLENGIFEKKYVETGPDSRMDLIRLKKLFPDGPRAGKMLKHKEQTEYIEALKEFVGKNEKQLQWNSEKKLYWLEK